VTAPVFLADEAVLAGVIPGQTVTLGGTEGRHAVSVRRLRSGEGVHLVDGRGHRVMAVVSGHTGRDHLHLVVTSDTVEQPPRPRLIVVLALIKGERAEAAVSMLTEVGVDEIVPWSAERSVVTWKGERAGRSANRWRTHAREAAKQSRRSWFPTIAGVTGTSGVVEQVRRSDQAFVLHEAAQEPLVGQPITPTGAITMVIGPEGGLTDSEVAVMTVAGATAVRLGPTVLRAGTATVAAAATVLAGSGRWS